MIFTRTAARESLGDALLAVLSVVHPLEELLKAILVVACFQELVERRLLLRIAVECLKRSGVKGPRYNGIKHPLGEENI